MNSLENEEFIRTIAIVGQQGFNKLTSASVLVFGLGGVGGYSCEVLSRSAVGKIIVVDKDVVEPSNLNRQIIATKDTIGMDKTDVIAQRAKSINPNIEVVKKKAFVDETNIDTFFDTKIDFVIDAIDTMSSKVAIWDYCQKHNIAYVSCLGMAKKMNGEAVCITTLAKTYNDPMAKALRKLARDKNISLEIPVVWSPENPIDTQKQLGSIVWVVAIAGMLCGQAAIKSILSK